MTEVQEEILNRLCPEYEDLKSQLEQYSDFELNMIINNLPDNVDELQNAICSELQWAIIGDLCGPIINDWDNFFYENEGTIMDYCCDGLFISYNDSNRSYEIRKEIIIDLCSDLVSEAEGDYIINEEVDFSEIIADLNRYYPVKFCEI